MGPNDNTGLLKSYMDVETGDIIIVNDDIMGPNDNTGLPKSYMDVETGDIIIVNGDGNGFGNIFRIKR